MATAADFLTTYERIIEGNKTALAEIDNALQLEEQQQKQECNSTPAEKRQLTKAAIQAYENCLISIGRVFSIPVSVPDDMDAVEDEWRTASTIIRQLKRAQTELTYRIKVLRESDAKDNDGIAEEATENCQHSNETNGDRLADDGSGDVIRSVLLENPTVHNERDYKTILRGLRELMATKEECDVIFDTLFQSTAKLYKIQPDGIVTTIAGVASMSLVMCTVGGKWAYLNGISFIQCSPPEEDLSLTDTTTTTTEESNVNQFGGGGNTSKTTSPRLIWLYALVPTSAVCYRTNYGAFILPDLENDDAPGSAFGIMLIDSSSPNNIAIDDSGAEDKTLTDLEQFFLDLLEAVLSGKVEKLVLPSVPPTTFVTQGSLEVSQCIVRAADFVANNLVRGAEKTGEFMVWGTPYIIRQLKPAPADAPPISSTVQTSVEVAKTVTSTAAGVTGWVAGKVGSASLAIGRFLAPHIQANGAALLQRGFGWNNEDANDRMEGAMTIAAGAVEGFGTVFEGLETSAKILGKSLGENSTKIIEHKYGESAANIAVGTFETFGNAFNVSQNVNYMTPKGLAKKMVKSTGKAVVDDYKCSLRDTKTADVDVRIDNRQPVPAIIALYPDIQSKANNRFEKNI